MDANQFIQNFGTVSIASLGALLLVLSQASTVVFDKWGREATRMVGAYILTTACLRVLVLYGYITPDEVRVASGLVAFGAVVILVQIIVLARVERGAA